MNPREPAGFTVDGHPLVAIEAGHSDTDDSIVRHALPASGLLSD